eukprot:2620841-Karenia_brevis.AAC.1
MACQGGSIGCPLREGEGGPAGKNQTIGGKLQQGKSKNETSHRRPGNERQADGRADIITTYYHITLSICPTSNACSTINITQYYGSCYINVGILG